MLILLQAVLGFDNLLYISLESKRVDKAMQSSLRRWGIGIAVALTDNFIVMATVIVIGGILSRVRS